MKTFVGGAFAANWRGGAAVFAGADDFACTADASLGISAWECAVTFAVVLPPPFVIGRAATRTEVFPWLSLF